MRKKTCKFVVFRLVYFLSALHADFGIEAPVAQLDRASDYGSEG
jgi:hypothetical protein